MRCDSCNYPYVEPEFRNKLPTGQTVCDNCKELMKFKNYSFEDLKASMWRDMWAVEGDQKAMARAFPKKKL